MAVRSDHEATLVSAINSGKVRCVHEALLISVTAPIVPLSYPLTPPVQLKPQSMKFRMVDLVGETVSPFTGGQQVQQWPGQWFEVDVALRPMQRVDAEPVIAFLGALHGRFGTFLLGDHNAKTPQGVATGVPLVSGTNASGLNTLNTKGWTASIAGILKAGDYIQVTTSGGPQRLYKNLLDANSDGAGNATLQIFPNIREPLVDGLSIVTANTAGYFRLNENVREYDINKARVYGISFKAKEAI